MRLRKNEQKTVLQKSLKVLYALVGILLFVGFVSWAFRRSELT